VLTDVHIFSVATDVVSAERLVEDASGGGGSLAEVMCPPASVRVDDGDKQYETVRLC